MLVQEEVRNILVWHPLHRRWTLELLTLTRARSKCGVRVREKGRKKPDDESQCFNSGKKEHWKRDCLKRALKQKTSQAELTEQAPVLACEAYDEDTNSLMLTLSSGSPHNDGDPDGAKVLSDRGVSLSPCPPQFCESANVKKTTPRVTPSMWRERQLPCSGRAQLQFENSVAMGVRSRVLHEQCLHPTWYSPMEVRSRLGIVLPEGRFTSEGAVK